ncbi:MAG: ABC transporter permease [Deltaproteobacteria bacterium]|nr:ABC transporter permease [Deltaproteobacteria bacterium]
MRVNRRTLFEVAVAAAAVLLAFLVGGLVIAFQGHSPIEVYGVFFDEALLEPLGLGQVLFKTTTLTFTGLAAAFSFRAGLFNIGGEGQLYLGAFACALVGVGLPTSTPSAVAVPLCVAAAFLGGALAAFVPAVLKAAKGTHEVITTMMMSFILLALVNYGLEKVRVPETVRTPEVIAASRLAHLSALESSLRGSDGNFTIFLSMAAALLVWLVFAWSPLGYDLRAVGYSPKAAEYGGVEVGKLSVVALLVAGGLAGLGGVNFVLGSPGYFEQNFAPYQGYLGIAVALLARNHPVAIVPAAFLFSLLAEGGQAIQPYVPKELGEILQAVVILFVVVGSKLVERAALARPGPSQ